MIDVVDTFLTTLYVTVDDFRHSSAPEDGSQPPGPEASLSPSEVVTLALFAQWARFASERDFYRYAKSHLRGAFPTLPHRSQFNRLVRLNLDLIESLALHLAALLSNTREKESESIPGASKLWIARLYLSGTSSAAAKDGWQVMPTSAGLTVWGGTRACACSWPPIPRESSRVLASVRQARRTNSWPRLSSPCAQAA